MKMSMEKVSENAVKVNENPIKEEKNMEKVNEKAVKVSESAVIMDATAETKAKTKALNTKKEAKPKVIRRKPAKSSSNPKKGRSVMTQEEKLVKVLEDAAKSNKDLYVKTLVSAKGAKTFQLKRGGDNVACVRGGDVLAHRPIGIFSEALMLKAPWFAKNGKTENGDYGEIYTHILHVRKNVDPDVFAELVDKCVKDKHTTKEWKDKVGAVVKYRKQAKTDRELLADIKAKETRIIAEKKAIEARMAKTKKAGGKTKVRKPAKKASVVIAKVADAVA